MAWAAPRAKEVPGMFWASECKGVCPGGAAPATTSHSQRKATERG